MSQDYPIPEALSHQEYGQELNWYPLAFDASTEKYFLDIIEEQQWHIKPLLSGWVVGTALRLIRTMHFKNDPEQ